MPNWRIMIVDDEEDILDLVGRVLETKYEVVKAFNGLDALEKLERYEPDFIILDVMMPLMDGFDTCQALRRNPDYRETPIYFLTSASSREDVKKGYAMGGNLYLQKPFDPFRLLKNIDFYIERNPVEPKTKKYSVEQLREIDKKKAPEKPEQTKPGIPPRVMLIDDNRESLELLSMALKKNKGKIQFEVIPCQNSVSALSMIVHAQPDIIILDIQMPKLDGFQLCKIIKVNENLKDIEIQFISAVATPKDAEYAKRLTGNKLLRKPMDMSEFYQAVVEICEKPGFKVAPKRKNLEEIVTEIRRSEQKEWEELRRKKVKEVHQEKVRPIEEFYKEYERESETNKKDRE